MEAPFPKISDFPGIEPWGKFAEANEAEGSDESGRKK